MAKVDYPLPFISSFLHRTVFPVLCTTLSPCRVHILPRQEIRDRWTEEKYREALNLMLLEIVIRKSLIHAEVHVPGNMKLERLTSCSKVCRLVWKSYFLVDKHTRPCPCAAWKADSIKKKCPQQSQHGPPCSVFLVRVVWGSGSAVCR